VPPLVLAADGWRTRGVTLAAIALPFWGVWLYATFRSDTHIGEWVGCCVVLGVYATALVGLLLGLRLARLPRLGCSAIVTVIGLAWLTWPIWMSRTWDGASSAKAIDPFIKVHPGMAINGQLFRQFGSWTEQSVAYHLTDLSQNVPYSLPKSVWPCVLFHGAIAAALIALSVIVERRRVTTPTREPAPATTS
jgi:hypothetical protein